MKIAIIGAGNMGGSIARGLAKGSLIADSDIIVSNPSVEIDKVTTPGGITIKGINELEHNGFTSAVIKAMKASK